MKPITIITISYLVLLLVGCSELDELTGREPPQPQVIEKEVTVEKIIYEYRNITVVEPCNVTCPNHTYIYSNTTDRELELIRRIKFLEGQTDKYFNDSECNDELERVNETLQECEYELCHEWNTSWCD